MVVVVMSIRKMVVVIRRVKRVKEKWDTEKRVGHKVETGRQKTREQEKVEIFH